MERLSARNRVLEDMGLPLLTCEVDWIAAPRPIIAKWIRVAILETIAVAETDHRVAAQRTQRCSHTASLALAPGKGHSPRVYLDQ
jgi:hypothetical protein